MSAMPEEVWCEACGSYHARPRDRAHWRALGCFAAAPLAVVETGEVGAPAGIAIALVHALMESCEAVEAVDFDGFGYKSAIRALRESQRKARLALEIARQCGFGAGARRRKRPAKPPG